MLAREQQQRRAGGGREHQEGGIGQRRERNLVQDQFVVSPDRLTDSPGHDADGQRRPGHALPAMRRPRCDPGEHRGRHREDQQHDVVDRRLRGPVGHVADDPDHKGEEDRTGYGGHMRSPGHTVPSP